MIKQLPIVALLLLATYGCGNGKPPKSAKSNPEANAVAKVAAARFKPPECCNRKGEFHALIDSIVGRHPPFYPDEYEGRPHFKLLKRKSESYLDSAIKYVNEFHSGDHKMAVICGMYSLPDDSYLKFVDSVKDAYLSERLSDCCPLKYDLPKNRYSENDLRRSDSNHAEYLMMSTLLPAFGKLHPGMRLFKMKQRNKVVSIFEEVIASPLMRAKRRAELQRILAAQSSPLKSK